MNIIKYNHELHNRPYLDINDNCYYFFEKEGEGYSVSNANQIVFNFKKPLNRKGFPDWRYKAKAIKTFADYICDALKPIKDNIIMIPAPTSKPRNHNEFDNRLDIVTKLVQECNTNIHVEFALDTIDATTPAHLGGSRSPAEIYANTKWCGIDNLNSEFVILVDDVLTSGGHFKAYKQKILDSQPHIKQVIGIFLALQV